MQSKNPKISVLTPIYNTDPKHLREMVESILAQTFTDFEFLILNDSPDNQEIESIVLEYATHDDRIKYFKNDKNIGITLSRNKLLKMATGEYVAIFDHDDISVPTRLSKQIEYLDSHPDVGVVSGWLEYFGNKNDILKTPEHDTDIKIKLCENCCVAHTASMIRKSLLVDNDIYYEGFYSPSEDYRLWTRLADVTHFYNIQEVLVKYRTSVEQTSVRQQSLMNVAHRMIYLDFRDKHPGLYDAFKKDNHHTNFRLNLFAIPLLKIKHNKIYLFSFLPIIKIKWE